MCLNHIEHQQVSIINHNKTFKVTDGVMLFNNIRMHFGKQSSNLQRSKWIYFDPLLLQISCVYFRLVEMIRDIQPCQKYLSLQWHIWIITANDSNVLMKQAEYCETKQISKETRTDFLSHVFITQ